MVKIVSILLFLFISYSGLSQEVPGGPPSKGELIGYWKMVEWPNPDVQKINPWPLPYQWFAFYKDGKVMSMMQTEDLDVSSKDLELVFSSLPTKNTPFYELKGQFLTIKNPEIKGYVELWGVNIFTRDMGSVKAGDLVMSLANHKTGEPVYYRLLRKVE